MTQQPADLLGAIRSVLIADTGVNALVSGRVGYEIPADDVDAMPQPCVILNPSGGPGIASTQMFGRRRIDTFCYGATKHDSEMVNLAVRSALKELPATVSDDVLIHSITVLAEGATGLDPETQWPVTLASYLVTAADHADA